MRTPWTYQCGSNNIEESIVTFVNRVVTSPPTKTPSPIWLLAHWLSIIVLECAFLKLWTNRHGYNVLVLLASDVLPLLFSSCFHCFSFESLLLPLCHRFHSFPLHVVIIVTADFASGNLTASYNLVKNILILLLPPEDFWKLFRKHRKCSAWIWENVLQCCSQRIFQRVLNFPQLNRFSIKQ